MHEYTFSSHHVCLSIVLAIEVMLPVGSMVMFIPFIIGDVIDRNGVPCIVVNCNLFIGNPIDRDERW